jgi:capsular exopolysaccharide synthesis family protein
MKRPNTPAYQLTDLTQQRQRAADIRRGIRDLRRKVERLRENEELYDDMDDLEVDMEDRSVQHDQSGHAQNNGHGEPAPARDEAALTLQSNISAFQRAVERLGVRNSPPETHAAGGAGGASALELVTYWKIVRKRLWLILLLMIVGGAGTGYYVSQQPPRYSSSTTLYLNPAVASSYLYYAYDGLQSLASTYSEFMRTRSFASRVSEELNGTIGEGQVLGAISTQYVESTQFFRITATTSDPQLAQSLANTAAKVLIAQNIARQQAEQEQRAAQSKPNPERERLIEVRTNLQQELDLYNGQIATLQSQLDRLKAAPASEETDREILNIQQQLLNVHSLRMGAMTGLADTQAAVAETATTTEPSLDTAVVVDAATLPGAPLPVNLVQQVLIALLASLTIGAALAFLLEYTDYTVKTPEAMEAIYGMPVQGVIGLARKRASGTSPAALVALDAPRSPIAESFRALRTGVYVAGLTSPIRKLMITSGRPSEGKSFVAGNLAVSLAQTGATIILVDCDLRRPCQHYQFELVLDPGFTNLVIDPELKIEDVLQPTRVEGLRVLTCGIIPPNPAELIGSKRAAEVMDQLAEHADIVIFDTPPAATVTDALVIAPRVDAVIQVVLSGATRIDVVRRCKLLLERNGARLLGPVLNQVARVDMTSYEYYYSSGYYGKGGEPRQRRRHKSLKQSTTPLLVSAASSNGTANGNGAHGSANGNGSSNAHGSHGTANANGTHDPAAKSAPDARSKAD